MEFVLAPMSRARVQEATSANPRSGNGSISLRHMPGGCAPSRAARATSRFRVSPPRAALRCQARLDDDRERNEQELAAALNIARAGHADILAVGNEVLLRGELPEEELIDYIQRARQAAPDVPVGYVDAYFLFEDYPRVTENCDVILANCYPFWEGCPAEHALLYMKEMYRRASQVANGKKVIISETGWPNIGTATDGAMPSCENAIKYFVDTHKWAEEDGIETFYFSAFDEAWKVDKEGDVGAYWGLWDKDGGLKYG